MSNLLPAIADFAQHTLAQGAMTFADRQLAFERDLTADETKAALEFMTRVHDSSRFWWGQLLAQLKKQKISEFKAQATPEWIKAHEERAKRAGTSFDLDEAALEWADGFTREAARNSDDSESLLEAMTVCETLGEVFRLSWQHHREAVAECGRENGAEAIRWLRKAEENKWTPSVMRAEIRRAQASYARPSNTKRSLTLTSEIRRLSERFKAVTSEHPVSTWSPAEVGAFMEDALSVMQLMQAVQKRWEQINPDLGLA